MGDDGTCNCGVDGDMVRAQQVMDRLIGPGKIELYLLGRLERHVAVDAIIGQHEVCGVRYPAGILCSCVVAGHASLRIQGDVTRLIFVYVVTGSAVHLR